MTMVESTFRNLFVETARAVVACAGLAAHAAGDPLRGSYRRPVARVLVLLVFVPSLALLQAWHWLCFLLDEILFRGWHKVAVDAPVFIVGPPRSGTTHLHRVLAEDRERFTTMPAWELFLAPAIVQKRMVRALARLDRRLGGWLRRAVARVERSVLGGFDSTHRSALGEAEEDFYLLLMNFSCTGLLLAFPRWRRLWRLAAPLDHRAVAEVERVLGFYRCCLRKHLHEAPEGARLLSKNASFASWLPMLDKVFPDAVLVVTTRSPEAAVPSMLSCADTTRRFFAAETTGGSFHRQLTDLMRNHYAVLASELPRLPRERVFVIGEADLRGRLGGSLEEMYRHFGWTPSAAFRAALGERDRATRDFRSAHVYAAADFDLDEAELRRCFPCLDPGNPQAPGESPGGHCGADVSTSAGSS